MPLLSAQHTDGCQTPDPPQIQALVQSCSRIEPTMEEITRFPEAVIKVMIHSEEAPGGQNFTCDLNNPFVAGDTKSDFYAPHMIGLIMDEVKEIFEEGVVDNGLESDTRIRFEYLNGDLCSSLNLYGPVNDRERASLDRSLRPAPEPGALNIYFGAGGEWRSRGQANQLGGNESYVWNPIDIFANPDDHGSNTGNWTVARVTAHEIGHNLNLRHTFSSFNPCNCEGFDYAQECNPPPGEGCFNNGTRQFMMGYNSGQNLITPCETEEMWKWLVNNPRDWFDVDFCSYVSNQDMIIQAEVLYDDADCWPKGPPIGTNSNITWLQKKKINSNIIIPNGVTLRIECEVEMAPNRRIIVEEGGKLVVDGGTLTAMCEDTYWYGIRVVGNLNDDPNNADVVLNDALIEKTTNTAVSMKPPVPWPAMQTKGGGVVHADNTIFDDVFRGISLIQFSSAINSSYAKDCTFSNAELGLTNWNCASVNIDNCTFTNIAREAIATDGGMFDIVDSDINGDRVGILFADVTAALGSTVKDNSITSDVVGIKTYGATFQEQTFVGNFFYGPETGIWSDGDSHCEINENEFRTYSGVIASNNGTHTNKVYNNWFDQTAIGIAPSGQNDNFNFHTNCFNTTNTDVVINGTVATHISSGRLFGTATFYEAANCFSHAGMTGSTLVDVQGSHNLIRYYETEVGTYDDCHDIKTPSSTLVPTIGADNTDACQNGFVPGDGYTGTMCDPNRDSTAVSVAFDEINTEMSNVQNDPTLNNIDRQIILQELQQCRINVVRLMVEIEVEKGNWPVARSKAQLDPSEDGWVMTYSTYIRQYDLDAAETFLNNTGPGSQNWQDFKTAQYINILDLRSGPVDLAKSGAINRPSKERLKLIERVKRLALKDENPYSGYIKALYYRMTGDILHSKVTLPDAKPHLSAFTSHEELEIKVSPNPSSGLFKIIKNIDKAIDVKIYDFAGRERISARLNGLGSFLDLSNETPGVYLIVFTDETGVVFTQKIVKQ